MATIRLQPYRELFSDQKQLDRFFGDVFQQDSKNMYAPSQGWTPAVDVLENDQKFTIKMDLAGVEPNGVEVSVHHNLLTIKGERKFENQRSGTSCHRIERAYGSFSRTFRLPENVNPEGLTAEYKGGVLTLTLQKREQEKPKTIKISVDSSSL